MHYFTRLHAVFWTALLLQFHCATGSPTDRNDDRSPSSQRNDDEHVEQILVQRLLKGYEKKVKPNKKPVTVRFKLEIYQLVDVYDGKQAVKINAWVTESWHDRRLRWEPARYDNITSISLPYDAVWTPQTVLYNTLEMNMAETTRLMDVKLTVGNDSCHIDMLYPTILTFSCRMDSHLFPFDTQVCGLQFGSWVQDTKTVVYEMASVRDGLENFIHNEEWELLDFQGVHKLHKYSYSEEPWSNLHYNITIRRLPLFYVANLIAPTCIITLISIIGFFLPSNGRGERHEKISLGLTTLLAMSILLLMVADKMPTSSSFPLPLIARFFLAQISLTAFGTFMGTVVIYLQNKGGQGQRLSPRGISWLTQFSRLVGPAKPSHLEEQKKLRGGVQLRNRAATVVMQTPSPPLDVAEQPLVLQLAHGPNNNENSAAPMATFSDFGEFSARSINDKSDYTRLFADEIRKHFADLRQLLRETQERDEDSVNRSSVEYDWAAEVVERSSLLLCLICALIMCFGFFLYGMYHL